MNRIEIDRDSCSGCQTCFDSCFVDVYRWDDEAEQPIVAYPEDCTACNMCELECPTGAIEVVMDYEHRDWPPVIERGFPYVPGKAEA